MTTQVLMNKLRSIEMDLDMCTTLAIAAKVKSQYGPAGIDANSRVDSFLTDSLSNLRRAMTNLEELL